MAATVIEVPDSRSHRTGSSPGIRKTFKVNLPVHQATSGPHVGIGPGLLPGPGSTETLEGVQLFFQGFDARPDGDAPQWSLVDAVYGRIEQSISFDPLSPTYQPFTFTSTQGGIVIPLVKETEVVPGRFVYAVNEVTVLRPEVLLTRTVNIPIISGLPSLAQLALITTQTGRIHTFAGGPFWLFEGGQGDVVSETTFQVTYQWRGVPTFEALPAGDYFAVPEVPPHAFLRVIPGPVINYGQEDAQQGPPTIVVVDPYQFGDHTLLPGMEPIT